MMTTLAALAAQLEIREDGSARVIITAAEFALPVSKTNSLEVSRNTMIAHGAADSRTEILQAVHLAGILQAEQVRGQTTVVAHRAAGTENHETRKAAGGLELIPTRTVPIRLREAREATVRTHLHEAPEAAAPVHHGVAEAATKALFLTFKLI